MAFTVCCIVLLSTSYVFAVDMGEGGYDEVAYERAFDTLRYNGAVSSLLALPKSFPSSEVSADRDNSTALPNDALLNPNNATIYPNDATRSPNGASARPNDATLNPNDATLRPNNFDNMR